MIPRVVQFLRAANVVADIRPNTSLSAIKMRNTSLPGGSLVALLFVDDAPTPRYVLRLPRDPAQSERLSVNYATLEALVGIPDLRGTVPVPIFTGLIEGVLTTLETFLEGASLAIEMALADRVGNDVRFVALLKRACDWLWRLHAATWCASDHTFVPSCRQEISALAQQEFLSTAEADALWARLAPLAATPLPFARCHGDFNPNNLLVVSSGEAPNVVDWEYSAPGCALFDLFQLVTIAYLFPVALEAREARLRALWSPQTRVGSAFTAALERYGAQVGVPVAALRPVFSGYLVHRAFELARLCAGRSEPMMAFWHDLLAIERTQSATFME